MSDRWVVVSVDASDKVIKGGPFLWDGETEWVPPEPGRLVGEADALREGYTWPSPPEQP